MTVSPREESSENEQDSNTFVRDESGVLERREERRNKE